MIKEDVLDALSVLGFRPKELEEFGYQIVYEGQGILYADVEDTESVNFVMPNVFEITEENKSIVYYALVQLGSEVKYVQSYIVGDDRVWLNYVHFVVDNKVTPELIEHIITVLSYAAMKFHFIINSTFVDES